MHRIPFLSLLRTWANKGLVRLIILLFRSRSYPLFGIANGCTKGPLEIPLYPLVHKPRIPLDPALLKPYAQQMDLIMMDPPGGGMIVVPNGISTALGGHLTAEGRLVTRYLVAANNRSDPRVALFRFSARRLHPRIYETDRPVFTLTSGWQNSFYHWMHEVLPRLHLLEKGGTKLEQFSGYFYLSLKEPFQRESVRLLGISQEQIIDASIYDAVHTPELLIPSSLWAPSEWGCRFLRDRLLPHCRLQSPRALYVSRRDVMRRYITNEDAVYGLLRERGFERVELTALSFQEQISYFASATHLVGAHGAGWSHLVFCQPGTPLLDCFDPSYFCDCYWRLCSCIGSPYQLLFGETEGASIGALDKPITLDLKKLDDAVTRMMCHA